MKLGYVIIYVPEVKAAMDFYEKAFGLKPSFYAETGMFGSMDTGTTSLAFVVESYVEEEIAKCHLNRLSEKPASVEIALVSGNVAESFAKAVKAGAVAVVEPMQKPWGQAISYVRDLNGVLVEICSDM